MIFIKLKTYLKYYKLQHCNNNIIITSLLLVVVSSHISFNQSPEFIHINNLVTVGVSLIKESPHLVQLSFSHFYSDVSVLSKYTKNVILTFSPRNLIITVSWNCFHYFPCNFINIVLCSLLGCAKVDCTDWWAYEGEEEVLEHFLWCVLFRKI